MSKYNKGRHHRQQADYCRYIVQNQVLNILPKGSSNRDIKHDRTAYDIGYAYGEAGFAFEDAPEDFKKSQAFKHGYDGYNRRLKIDEIERKSGINYYNSGKRLEDMDEKYRVKQTDSFIEGYNYAARIAGINFYNNGGILELLSDEERAKLNEYFVLGYEEARFNNTTKVDEKGKSR